MEESGKRALIAMSGGVDSSVAAYLMTERGYHCAGVTMRQFCPEGGEAGSAQMETDAARVCADLGISHTVLDLTSQFRKEVMDPFVRAYEAGETPNPCVICNRRMRAGHLLAYARKQGFDLVVTGHYARIAFDAGLGRWLLRRGVDEGKDQSYVQYAMTQDQLRQFCFPLGELRKSRVRELAERLGLETAQKKDSQDICFVPDGDYGAFLERYTGKTYPKGDFLDQAGELLGRHRGAVRYTIGQRKGLRVSAASRLYVLEKDMAENTVTLGPEGTLYAPALLAGDVNWIAFERLSEPLRCTAQTRYHQPARPVTVTPQGEGQVRVYFDIPQRAVTPGQAVVFYEGDLVLGGGTILSPLSV